MRSGSRKRAPPNRPAFPPRRVYVGDTDLRAIGRIDPTLLVRAQRVTDAMQQVASCMPSGWPIGLEQRLFAYHWPLEAIDQAGVACEQRANWPDTRLIDTAPRQQIFSRPPSEYGLIRLFEAMNRNDFSADTVIAAVALFGVPALIRKGPITTTPFASGEVIEFTNPEVLAQRFERLVNRVRRPDPSLPPLVKAVSVYFETTLLHPLVDGNGRLARALFQCSLKQDLGIATPIFPLGPGLEPHKAKLLRAKFYWYFEGNASPLVQIILAITDTLCKILKDEMNDF